MQQQISVVTLGVADHVRSKRFYGEGFGWKPVFEAPGIVFYQMNGLMLGLWAANELEGDMKRPGSVKPGAFALAHNVRSKEEVQPLLDAPPHGGFRGYVADPDDHAWEIAWNPAWPIDKDGHVTWGV